MTEERQRQHYHANDLETRLRAYYGPALPERPLSSTSWDTLHRQLLRQKGRSLKKQEASRRYIFSKMRRPMARNTILPPFVQESLLRVQNEAHWSGSVPPICCTLRTSIHEPSVRVSSTFPKGRPTIRLALPIEAPITMQPVELDVLLAVGFARTVLMNRTSEQVLRFVLACLLLIGSCLVIYSVYGAAHKMPFLTLPIAIMLYIICGVIWLYRQYRIALVADVLVVRWLGRSRVCDGLHQLANRERKPHQRQWSEPSLDERIKRICGTQVTSRDKDLTLVS